MYIRAYINTELKKADTIYYIDNLNDMNKFRNIIISAIYKFMQNNKAENYDWQNGDNYFTNIYNLKDLSSFIDDMRSSYKLLQKSPYFPRNYIGLVSPKPTVKKRKKRMNLTDEQMQIVNTYIENFGKGTLLSDIDENTLDDIKKYTLHNDGFTYVVCRPIRDTSDPDAPELVYKLNGSSNITQTNAVRFTYCYQCMHDYGCYVDYLYVSPIMIAKYVKNK